MPRTLYPVLLLLLFFIFNGWAFYQISVNRGVFLNYTFSKIYFPYWCTIFVILIGSIVVFLKSQKFKKPPLFSWITLLLIFLTFLFLIKPKTMVFNDEDLYIQATHHIQKTYEIHRPIDVRYVEGKYIAERFSFNKFPSGYPSLLAIISAPFHSIQATAFGLNQILFLGCALLIYFLGLQFGNGWWGILGSSFFLTLPKNWIWFKTGTSEASTAFFAILNMLFLINFIKTPKWFSWFLYCASTAIAVTFRPEAILLVPLGFLTFLLNRKLVFNFFKKSWESITLLFLMISPSLVHLWGVRKLDWGALKNPKFSLHSFSKNFSGNFGYLIDFSRENGAMILLTGLALIGIFNIIKNKRLIEMSIPIWGITFFAVFCFYYTGNYSHGPDARWAILFSAPLCLLAAMGVFEFSKRWRWGNEAAMVITIAFQIFSLSHQSEYFNPAASYAYDKKVSREIIEWLPKNSYLFTHSVSFYSPYGISSGDMVLLHPAKKTLVELKAQFSGGVFVYFGPWCQFGQRDFQYLCHFVRNTYPNKIVKTFSNGQYSYHLARFHP